MCKRIRIYDKDIPTHDFEYCLRESDGKKCWYDHVTGEIYPEPEKEDKGYDSVVYLDNGTQYIDLGIPTTNEPKQEWISVRDRLPEEYTRVLTYSHADGVMIGSMDYDGDFRFPYCLLPDEPTHWMPLPEPPEKNNEEEQA